jgi:hypothetical protein
MTSGARLQPVTENSRRSRDAWRWLPAALAIVMLSSVCCVSTAQGTWTTAQLSVGRRYHAATSVGNVAIFAGGGGGPTAAGVGGIPPPAAGGGGGPEAYTNAVDLYSIVSGSWTTAQLSVARARLAATSVGIVALFAGGQTIDNSVAFASDAADLYNSATASWSTARLSVGRYDLAATSLGSLAIFAGGHTGNAYSDTVDLYNSVSGAWTTARLSSARRLLVATNAGDMAIFAGGLVDPSGGHQEGASDVVDLYNNVTNIWSTARLSAARYGLVATSLGNLAFFAGGFPMDPNWQHDLVDLYNSASGVWSTAQLSERRGWIAATRVGNVALFAGGRAYGSDSSNAVDLYSSEKGAWSRSQLSVARFNIAATSLGFTR